MCIAINKINSLCKALLSLRLENESW